MKQKMLWLKVKMKFFWKRIKRHWKNISRRTKVMVSVSTITLVLGGCIGMTVGYVIQNDKLQKAKQSYEEQYCSLEGENQRLEEKLLILEKQQEQTVEKKQIVRPWNLVLVNQYHPMEEGYKPKLKELTSGYEVDERIVDSARKMLTAAKEDGMNIVVCSAYRSVNRQKQLFNENVAWHLEEMGNYWDAYAETKKSVAIPGTSEHALGLALDLVSGNYMDLDEKQAETKEAKWLKENCYKYGFILRYPPEKMDITGIIYEPWHYRYVGVEDAKKIMESGLTLEEYLEELE